MSEVTCHRVGCSGRIEDGYCNICGHTQRRHTEGLDGSSDGSGSSAAYAGPDSRTITTGLGSTPYSRVANGWHRVPRSRPGTARKQLGAGLLSVPDLPSAEPDHAVLTDAKVPEHKRFCAKCDAPLRREAGFCGKCGTRYSFVPTLRTGDLVAGQYEVKGPLAYGGLGWIYLAFDVLLSRYVVLKGLLNAQDTSAAAVAVAERKFLASVKHPTIVSIYNFVEVNGEGFIVMEYVGGKTLKQIRKERGPLPIAEAIAYIHRILPAFAYLHRQGLVFCDFKPDNIMLEHDDVKLIDLGGVRRIGDPNGDIYGTVGYSAPEAGAGPTPASDLFTVGRTLAVLVMEIQGFGKQFRFRLPGPQEEPLFAEQESLYRFLLKATAEQPDDRFESAEEMGEQLLGVLREVVARESGSPRPGASQHFGTDLLPFEAAEAAEPVRPQVPHLPRPALDDADPGSQAVTAAAALPDIGRRIAALRLACQQFPHSRETRLRLAATLADAGEFSESEKILHDLGTQDPWDWKTMWFRGLIHLWRYQFAEARKLFDQVYFDLPGELAPKLAFAFAAEQEGDLPLAAKMYDLVSRVDPGMVSAVFGLARCRRQVGDSQGAVAALGRVPAASALFRRAQAEVDRMLLASHGPNAQRTANSQGTRDLEVAFAPLLRWLGGPPFRWNLEQIVRAFARMLGGGERARMPDEAQRLRPRT